MELERTHATLLRALHTDEAQTIEDLTATTELPPETLTSASQELAEDGLVEVSEEGTERIEVTAEGATYRREGLPEHRLLDAARVTGANEEAVDLGDVLAETGLSGEKVDIALSNFARKDFGVIDAGTVRIEADLDPNDDPEVVTLAAIDDTEANQADVDGFDRAVLEQLERRGLIEQTEAVTRRVQLTKAGASAREEGIETRDTIGELTPELLTSGDWQEAEFAAYNVEADAERIDGGRIHILRQTAERVKEVLVGMGFQEMEGPHVDADFWINDCLFMPQDHPARTHWDRFALSQPEAIDELPAGLVERVERAHHEGVGEDGEGYHSPWSESFARALALRGHTTSLTTRYLSGHQIGDIEPPARYFSVEKVYRNDTLDPTHLLEFFQIEGWVMAESLSVRDLMGTFEEFYAQFGITDLEFKPHYNPYTEPSFELFGTHPTTGELVEIGNSGLFREEMLQPLGVECDVMAWGLALERLLMLMYGFEDIRDIHGTLCDLELLRETEVTY